MLLLLVNENISLKRAVEAKNKVLPKEVLYAALSRPVLLAFTIHTSTGNKYAGRKLDI